MTLTKIQLRFENTYFSSYLLPVLCSLIICGYSTLYREENNTSCRTGTSKMIIISSTIFQIGRKNQDKSVKTMEKVLVQAEIQYEDLNKKSFFIFAPCILDMKISLLKSN